MRYRDTGAVMVMAVFVAILLTGLLYHVAGVGGASLEHQLMQDGADSAAFSAATVNARGMNILALINLIMVALLTILIALRMVQAILVFLLVVVATLCAFPPYMACNFVLPLENARAQVTEAADAYQNVAKQIIKGLTKAAEVINEVVPFIALAEGYHIAGSAPYNRVAEGGVVWPVFDGLPTQKGSYSELCKRAGRNVTVPIELILPGGIGEFVGATLGELIAELAESFTSYFCGDDGSGTGGDKPEPVTKLEEVSYPPGQYDESGSEMWDCVGVHPDSSNGKCYTADCRDCAELGCNHCFQKMRSDAAYRRGLFTVVKNNWVEWWQGATLVRVLEKGTAPDRWSLVERSGNPCISDDNPDPNTYYTAGCAAYQGPWRWDAPSSAPDVVPAIEEYAPRPICERQATQEVPGGDISYYLAQAGVAGGDDPPEMTLVRQTIYVALSSCTIEEEVVIEAEGEPMVSGDDEDGDMAPRVLDMDRFPDEAEITAVLWGKGHASARKKGVGVAADGAETGGSDARISFAAAEYYSMDENSEAMWHMRWLSRLVRFQWDGTGEGQGSESHGENNQDGFEQTSEAAGGIMGNLGLEGELNDYLLH